MKTIINNEGKQVTISENLYYRLITARDLEGLIGAIITDINGNVHAIELCTL